MLSRQHRLTADKDVTRVLRKGRAVFTNLIVVRAVLAEKGGSRTAVVVGTKVHKRAVRRNIIKRRIREALRVLIPQVSKPVDTVVIAQPESVGRSYADLRAALEYSFKKLGLL